jgi:hypothetical protein
VQIATQRTERTAQIPEVTGIRAAVAHGTVCVSRGPPTAICNALIFLGFYAVHFGIRVETLITFHQTSRLHILNYFSAHNFLLFAIPLAFLPFLHKVKLLLGLNKHYGMKTY